MSPSTLAVSEIRLLSLNVEGLDTMLLNPGFMDLVSEHDICLLTETMRKDNSKLNIDGLWDHSQVRPKCTKKGRNSGGITVLAKSHLRAGIKVEEESEGLLWLKLASNFFNFKEDLFVCAVYIPPQSTTNTLAKRTDYFGNLLHSTNRYLSRGNVLLAGDFNSRVGCEQVDTDTDLSFLEGIIPPPTPQCPLPERTSCDQVVNQNGKKLIHLCKSLDLKIANGRCPGDTLGNFTCFANRGSSVVDYVIGNNQIVNGILRLKVLPPDLTSVHSPISFKLRCNTSIKMNDDEGLLPMPAKVVWDQSKSDIFVQRLKAPEVAHKLEGVLRQLQDPETPKSHIHSLTKTFTETLVAEAKVCMKVSNLPTKKPLVPPRKSNKAKSFKWFDKECSNLKRRLQNLGKLLQKFPLNPHIRGQYCQTKKQYRRAVKGAKRTFEVEAIRNLQSKVGKPKEFWACLKNLGKKVNNSDLQPSSEEWVEHFSSLYVGNNDEDESQRILQIREDVHHRLDQEDDGPNPDFIMSPCTMDEVKEGIRRLKKEKAVAMDLVSNDMMIAGEDVIAPILVQLFNRIIQFELPPEVWCLGIIVPLFKSGDSKDVNNYRGITINSCLSKLFMLIMNDRLQKECDRNGLIHFNQIGFRKHFRPADHVFTLKTLIDKAFSEKKQLYTCFVDFRKAYDSVWRDALFFKLLENGISRRFIRLLRNFYLSSELCVKLPNGRSAEFLSKIGLKQGCNLSPLLFNIFINDFLTEVNIHLPHSPLLGNIPVNALFYADDLVLISETKEGLQCLLDKLYEYTLKWSLQVNKSKTKCVVFTNQRKRHVHVVNFGSAPLVTADSYCYLGTVFSRNGSLNEAGHVLHDKASKAMYGLIQKLYKFKSCDPKVMLEVFDKMVMPIALYNSEIWGTMCFPVNEKNQDILDVTPQKNPIEAIHYKFCKRLLGVNDKAVNWAVTSELGRYPTINLIVERMAKFWYHLIHSSSPILRSALQASVEMDASGKRVWFTHLRKCMTHLGIEHILYTSDPREVTYQVNRVKGLLRAKALEKWETKLSTTRRTESSKIHLYSHLKQKFGYEEYLSVTDRLATRISLTKVRLSSHNMPIEVGRYIGLERDDRVCPFCSADAGDEQHYLCECPDPLFLSKRATLFEHFEAKYPGFNALSSRDKTVALLTPKETVTVSKVGQFCTHLAETFKEFNTRSV